MGENGAGKSTLMHILAGVHQPDAGSHRLRREEVVAFADERAARGAGHRARLPGAQPVRPAERGREHLRRPSACHRAGAGSIAAELRRRTRDLLDEVGLDADPETPVERLSPSQQQLVEVAKALSLAPG